MAREGVWVRATRVTASVVGVLLVVLATTGIALVCRYRPHVISGETSGARRTAGIGLTARGTHRLASSLLLPAAGARWFWVHIVGLPLAPVGAIIAFAIRARRVRPAGDPAAPPSQLA